MLFLFHLSKILIFAASVDVEKKKETVSLFMEILSFCFFFQKLTICCFVEAVAVKVCCKLGPELLR